MPERGSTCVAIRGEREINAQLLWWGTTAMISSLFTAVRLCTLWEDRYRTSRMCLEPLVWNRRSVKYLKKALVVRTLGSIS